MQTHVVSAFEHSLSNLTERLTRLTDEADKKDKELVDMRKIIRELKTTDVQFAYGPGIRKEMPENAS